MATRHLALAVLLIGFGSAAAQDRNIAEFIPEHRLNCDISAPPAGAGLGPFPHDLILVFPRNADFPRSYSGCQLSWVEWDNGTWKRLHTLYFEDGKLKTEVMSLGNVVTSVCEHPGSKPVYPTERPKRGAHFCERDASSQTHVRVGIPTWPRECIENGHLPKCKEDPE